MNPSELSFINAVSLYPAGSRPSVRMKPVIGIDRIDGTTVYTAPSLLGFTTEWSARYPERRPLRESTIRIALRNHGVWFNDDVVIRLDSQEDREILLTCPELKPDCRKTHTKPVWCVYPLSGLTKEVGRSIAEAADTYAVHPNTLSKNLTTIGAHFIPTHSLYGCILCRKESVKKIVDAIHRGSWRMDTASLVIKFSSLLTLAMRTNQRNVVIRHILTETQTLKLGKFEITRLP